MGQDGGPARPEGELPDGGLPGEERGDGRGDDERESIWSIPASLKKLYFGLFTAQIIVAAVWLAQAALSDESLVGIQAKVLSVWQGMAPAAITSAAFALILTDAWKTSMVIGTWLEDELKKRRERRERRIVAVASEKAAEVAREKALAEAQVAVEAARAEERRKWQEWNRRREAAAAAGEEFTELPPGDGDPESQNSEQP